MGSVGAKSRGGMAVGLALALVAGMLLMAAGARANDVCNGITQLTDASGSHTSPSSVSPPVVCTGDLGGGDSQDWYGFNVSAQQAGQTIVVAMRQTTSTASQPPTFNLKLYNELDQDVTAPNPPGLVPQDGRGCLGSGTFETIPNTCTWIGAVQGTWRVGVVFAPGSSTASGSYVLTVAVTLAIPALPLQSCEPNVDAGNTHPGRTIPAPQKAFTCSGTLGAGNSNTLSGDYADVFSATYNSPINEIQFGMASTQSAVELDIKVEFFGPVGSIQCFTPGGVALASCTSENDGPDTIIVEGPGCGGVTGCYSFKVFLRSSALASVSYSMDVQETNA